MQMSRRRTLKGRPEANKLAKFLCERVIEPQGLTVREIAEVVPDGPGSSTWAMYLNGAKVIPKRLLGQLLNTVVPDRNERLGLTPDVWELWQAADAERRRPEDTGESSELVQIYRRLTEAQAREARAREIAASASQKIQELGQAHAHLESVISLRGQELESSQQRERDEIAYQLTQAQARLARTESELERAGRRRYTAEQAQRALAREVHEAREQIARLQEKAIRLEQKPEPSAVAVRAPRFQLDGLDEYLDTISDSGAREDDELADLVDEAQLDIDVESSIPSPRTVPGVLVPQSATPRAAEPSEEDSSPAPEQATPASQTDATRARDHATAGSGSGPAGDPIRRAAGRHPQRSKAGKAVISAGLAASLAVVGVVLVPEDTVPVQVTVQSRIVEASMPGERGSGCSIGDGMTNCTTVVTAKKGEPGPVSLRLRETEKINLVYWGCDQGPAANSCTVTADQARHVCATTTNAIDELARQRCAEITRSPAPAVAFRPLAWTTKTQIKILTEPDGRPEVLATVKKNFTPGSVAWSEDANQVAWAEHSTGSNRDVTSTVKLRNIKTRRVHSWKCSPLCSIAFVDGRLVSDGEDVRSYPPDGGKPTEHDIEEISGAALLGRYGSNVEMLSSWNRSELRTYALSQSGHLFRLISHTSTHPPAFLRVPTSSPFSVMAISPAETRALYASTSYASRSRLNLDPPRDF
ncbi:hypothetical protein AB0I99_17585 [Streptomyces spongiicola]|uniref:hypothetical protein n=1 Tax=Streptomyces spongiicola TaxID=1690221 RepID=UPI0033C86A8E